MNRRPLCAAAVAALSLTVAACGGGGGGSATTSVTTTPPSTQPATTSAGTGQGDAAAGATVYKEAGCGDCHILAAAGSTSPYGPNLDDLKPDFGSVVAQVTVGGLGMPSFKGQLSQLQINDVAAYVVQSTQG